ncbi:MAG: restriction endonuclease [Oscillospiraceae bacterium]|nr:restriction endonuclease [Oscillospiraceae bacterium]
MTYTDFLKASDEQIRLMLFDALSAAPEIRRKQLIEAVIGKITFTAEQMKNTAPGSELVSAKSRIGMILSSAMKSRYIIEDELGYMSLNSAEINYISKYQCRDFVVKALEGGSFTKQELFRRAEEHFCNCELSPEEKDLQLRSVLGQVIARLEEEAHICRCGDKYALAHDMRYPSTELGCYLREAALGGGVEKYFLKAVHTMGGEWFELYAVELLEKYFKKCGKTIISASVSGGSNDGGIDGIINTRDWLGYRELILMQMKNRNSIVTPKDVREFYGAVCAEQGSRGLYVTISSFHPEAQKLIDKVDNLIGIDGHRIFLIAKKCRYGLVFKNGKLCIDEEFFLKPIATVG